MSDEKSVLIVNRITVLSLYLFMYHDNSSSEVKKYNIHIEAQLQ